MGRPVEVLLLDDGELDDVQGILDDLGVSYGRVRGSAIAPETPAPRKLLVTTPRRLEAVDLPQIEDTPVRILIVDEDSPTLRARLREIGFDYLVRRPVHPEAMRLLVLHCVFSGEERRREPRVPVGFEISFRTGLLPRRATLADLSTRGCRILSKWAIEPGKRISVTIPQRAGVPESLSIRGKVIRMKLDEHLGKAGPYSAAVEFENIETNTRHELEWILEERARGPATLAPATPVDQIAVDPIAADPIAADQIAAELDPPETRGEEIAHGLSVEVDVRVDTSEAEQSEDVAPQADELPVPPWDPPAPPAEDTAPALEEAPAAEMQHGADAATPESDDAGDAERRSQPRAAYPHKVPAFGDRAMRVLLARDLSRNGMRVEHDSGLELGDRLHLAIYGDASEEPFLVWATVMRDDGANGMALTFDEVHPSISAKLESVVAGLPAVESLHHDEAAAMGSVVTEILDS